MVEAATHLTDHAFPLLPVRQWVLSVPKRLRYFMQRDGAVLNMVLRIFLRVIAQTLQTHSPGAASVDKAALHIGAIAFIHRFGSSLNAHVHFLVCVVDGVFEAVADDVVADVQATAPSVIFHPASAIDADAVAQVQATLQKRILRAFVARGLLEKTDAKDMLAYQHSGFSIDAGVCIEAHDRAVLGDKRCTKVDELHLTPLELIECITTLVPPPRTHRHRYFWCAGTEFAVQGRSGGHGSGSGSSDTCAAWYGRGRTRGGTAGLGSGRWGGNGVIQAD